MVVLAFVLTPDLKFQLLTESGISAMSHCEYILFLSILSIYSFPSVLFLEEYGKFQVILAFSFCLNIYKNPIIKSCQCYFINTPKPSFSSFQVLLARLNTWLSLKNDPVASSVSLGCRHLVFNTLQMLLVSHEVNSAFST